DRAGVGDDRRRRVDRRENAEPRLPARALRSLPAGSADADRARHPRRAGARLRFRRPVAPRAGHALDETDRLVTAPVLEAVDVSYTYPGPTPTKALDGFSLEDQDDEILPVRAQVGGGTTT